MDRAWWEKYAADVEARFKGERCGRGGHCRKYGITHLDKMQHFNNSGAAAVSLAIYRGAKTVIMLGYDCQHTNGKAHWHGDHPKGLGNAGSYRRWAESFLQLARHAAKEGVRVINCSRTTALTCFERGDLETMLRD
jgi:sugar phosphate isomerase/epimerase